MNLNLSKNIRKYRRDLSLSQEQLAERLGVSFQTVSKWERDECMPDITLLPRIAGFFHITVDALLGVNMLKEEEEVEAIIAKCAEADCHYRGDEIAALCEEGLAKYPNNFKLMAWQVYILQRIEPRRAIEVSDYLLANCTDSGLRRWVESNRCYALFNAGEKEKAIAAARELPCYYDTREDTLRSFLKGDELLTHVEDDIILTLAYEFWISIRKIGDSYTPDERIALYKKSNAVYDAIYETDDLAFKLTRKMRNYQGMAEVSLFDGRTDDGLSYLREAADCAVRHDALPQVVESAALLFRAHPYDRRYEGHFEACRSLLHDLETEDEFYADVREQDAFRAILAMLKN